MNEFLYELGWIAKKYELLVICWFLITQLPKYGWSLFFARHQGLNSLALHELHSCFLAAIVFFISHFLGTSVEQALVNLDFDQLNRIKVFYTGMMAQQFVILVIIYVVHRLKGCLFSRTARICMYMILFYMLLSFIQLIARGYFDYHRLNLAYSIGCWMSNLVALLAISTYPVRHTLRHIAEYRKQDAN